MRGGLAWGWGRTVTGFYLGPLPSGQPDRAGMITEEATEPKAPEAGGIRPGRGPKGHLHSSSCSSSCTAKGPGPPSQSLCWERGGGRGGGWREEERRRGGRTTRMGRRLWGHHTSQWQWLLRSQLRSRDCRQGAVLVYTLTPPLLESTSLAEVCRSPTP